MLFIRSVLVLFYEQHQDWISTTRPNLEQRPDTLRFAWLLRSAAAHLGPLNMNDPRRRPFVWRHLEFDSTSAGFPVFGGSDEGPNAMSLGDVILFLCDFSDELDYLRCPLP